MIFKNVVWSQFLRFHSGMRRFGKYHNIQDSTAGQRHGGTFNERPKMDCYWRLTRHDVHIPCLFFNLSYWGVSPHIIGNWCYTRIFPEAIFFRQGNLLRVGMLVQIFMPIRRKPLSWHYFQSAIPCYLVHAVSFHRCLHLIFDGR